MEHVMVKYNLTSAQAWAALKLGTMSLEDFEQWLFARENYQYQDGYDTGYRDGYRDGL